MAHLPSGNLTRSHLLRILAIATSAINIQLGLYCCIIRHLFSVPCHYFRMAASISSATIPISIYSTKIASTFSSRVVPGGKCQVFKYVSTNQALIQWMSVANFAVAALPGATLSPSSSPASVIRGRVAAATAARTSGTVDGSAATAHDRGRRAPRRMLPHNLQCLPQQGRKVHATVPSVPSPCLQTPQAGRYKSG